MVAISIALIMAPAAYHRQAEPDSVSRTFARYASSLVTLAMAPLMLAIAIEVALVTFSIKPWLSLSAGLGAMVAVIYRCAGMSFRGSGVRTSAGGERRRKFETG